MTDIRRTTSNQNNPVGTPALHTNDETAGKSTSTSTFSQDKTPSQALSSKPTIQQRSKASASASLTSWTLTADRGIKVLQESAETQTQEIVDQAENYLQDFSSIAYPSHQIKYYLSHLKTFLESRISGSSFVDLNDVDLKFFTKMSAEERGRFVLELGSLKNDPTLLPKAKEISVVDVSMNGGLGSSMGLNPEDHHSKATGIFVPVSFETPSGKITVMMSIMEVKLRTLLSLQKSFRQVRITALNSTITQNGWSNFLKSECLESKLGIIDQSISNEDFFRSNGLIIDPQIIQTGFPKVDANNLQLVNTGNLDRDLSPGGHGQILHELYFTGILKKYSEENVDILFLTNADGKQARPIPEIASKMVEENIPAAVITTDRTPIDAKGGIIVVKLLKLFGIELNQVDPSNQEAFKAIGLNPNDEPQPFNTNTIAINIKLVLQILDAIREKHGEKAVHEFLMPATIASDDKAMGAKKLEGAILSVVLKFPNVKIFNASARERFEVFTPVKTPFDVLYLYFSDAYSLDGNSGQMSKTTDSPPPSVTLSGWKGWNNLPDTLKAFGIAPNFSSLFTGGNNLFANTPSLSGLKELTIQGEVYLPNVKLEGIVEIVNESKKPLDFASDEIRKRFNTQNGKTYLRDIFIHVDESGSIYISSGIKSSRLRAVSTTPQVQNKTSQHSQFNSSLFTGIASIEIYGTVIDPAVLIQRGNELAEKIRQKSNDIQNQASHQSLLKDIEELRNIKIQLGIVVAEKQLNYSGNVPVGILEKANQVFKQLKLDNNPWQKAYSELMRRYVNYWWTNNENRSSPYLSYNPESADIALKATSYMLPESERENFQHFGRQFLLDLIYTNAVIAQNQSETTQDAGLRTWTAIKELLGEKMFDNLSSYHKEVSLRNPETASAFLALLFQYIRQYKITTGQDLVFSGHIIEPTILRTAFDTSDNAGIKDSEAIKIFVDFFRTYSGTNQPDVSELWATVKPTKAYPVHTEYRDGDTLQKFMARMPFLPARTELDENMQSRAGIGLTSVMKWGESTQDSKNLKLTHTPINTNKLIGTYHVLSGYAREYSITDVDGTERNTEIDFMEYLATIYPEIAVLLKSADSNGRIEITVPSFMFKHPVNTWSIPLWAQEFQKRPDFVHELNQETIRRQSQGKVERPTDESIFRYINIFSQTTGSNPEMLKHFVATLLPIMPILRGMVPIYDLGGLVSHPEFGATKYKLVFVPDETIYEQGFEGINNLGANIRTNHYGRMLDETRTYLLALEQMGVTKSTNGQTIKSIKSEVEEMQKENEFYRSILLDRGSVASFRSYDDILEMMPFFEKISRTVQRIKNLSFNHEIGNAGTLIPAMIGNPNFQEHTITVSASEIIDIFKHLPTNRALEVVDLLIILKRIQMETRINPDELSNEELAIHLAPWWTDNFDISGVISDFRDTIRFDINTSPQNSDIHNDGLELSYPNWRKLWSAETINLNKGHVALGETVISEYFTKVKFPNTGFWKNIFKATASKYKLSEDLSSTCETFIRKLSGDEIPEFQTVDAVVEAVWNEYLGLHIQNQNEDQSVSEDYSFLLERVTIFTTGTELYKQNAIILGKLRQKVSAFNSRAKNKVFSELQENGAFSNLFNHFSREWAGRTVDLEQLKKSETSWQLQQSSNWEEVFTATAGRNPTKNEIDFHKKWNLFREVVISNINALINDGKLGLEAWIQQNYKNLPVSIGELKQIAKFEFHQRIFSDSPDSKFITDFYTSRFAPHTKFAQHTINTIQSILAEYLSFILTEINDVYETVVDIHLDDASKTAKSEDELIEKTLSLAGMTADELGNIEAQLITVSYIVGNEAPQGWRTRVGLVTREVIAPRVATDAHEREEKQARFDKLYSKFLGFSDDIDNLSANILLAQSEQNPERQLLMIDEGLKILTGIALKFDEIQSEWIEASDIAVLLPQYQSQMDSWTLSLEQHQAFVESSQRELSELRLETVRKSNDIEAEKIANNALKEIEDLRQKTEIFKTSILQLNDEIQNISKRVNEIQNTILSGISTEQYFDLKEEIESLTNKAYRLKINVSEMERELTNLHAEFERNEIQSQRIEGLSLSLNIIRDYLNEITNMIESSGDVIASSESSLKRLPASLKPHIIIPHSSALNSIEPPNLTTPEEQIAIGNYTISIQNEIWNQQPAKQPSFFVLFTQEQTYLISASNKGSIINSLFQKSTKLTFKDVFGNNVSINTSEPIIEIREISDLPENHPLRILVKNLETVYQNHNLSNIVQHLYDSKASNNFWNEFAKLLSQENIDPVVVTKRWLLSRYEPILKTFKLEMINWFILTSTASPRTVSDKELINASLEKLNEQIPRYFTTIFDEHNQVYDEWVKSIESNLSPWIAGLINERHASLIKMVYMLSLQSEDLRNKFNSIFIEESSKSDFSIQELEKRIYKFYLEYEIYLVGRLIHGGYFHFSWEEMLARARFYRNNENLGPNPTKLEIIKNGLLANLYSRPRLYGLAYTLSKVQAISERFDSPTIVANNALEVQANYFMETGRLLIDPSDFEDFFVDFAGSQTQTIAHELSYMADTQELKEWFESLNLPEERKEFFLKYFRNYAEPLSGLMLMAQSKLPKARNAAINFLNKADLSNPNTLLYEMTSLYLQHRNIIVSTELDAIVQISHTPFPLTNSFAGKTDSIIENKFPELKSFNPIFRTDLLQDIFAGEHPFSSRYTYLTLAIREFPMFTNMLIVIALLHRVLPEDAMDEFSDWAKSIEDSSKGVMLQKRKNINAYRNELIRIYTKWRPLVLGGLNGEYKRGVSFAQILTGKSKPWLEQPIIEDEDDNGSILGVEFVDEQTASTVNSRARTRSKMFNAQVNRAEVYIDQDTSTSATVGAQTIVSPVPIFIPSHIGK